MDHLPSWQIMDDFFNRLQEAIHHCRTQHQTLANQDAPWCYQDWLQLEDTWDKLALLWSEVNHLYHVVQQPSWRRDYAKAEALLVDYYNEIAQHPTFYQRLRTLLECIQAGSLPKDADRALAFHLRDLRRQGAELPSDQQKSYAELDSELTRLTTLFSDQTLDATEAFEHWTDDAEAISPLPNAVKAHMACNDDLNRWRLTLEPSIYQAVMTYSPCQALRQTLYQAYLTRASSLYQRFRMPSEDDYKPGDNGPVMVAILQKRAEMAKILGYHHFADYALETRMVTDSQEAERFIEDLASRIQPQAQEQWQELQEHARTDLQLKTLAPWDMAYAAESLKRKQLSLDDQAVRSFLPLDTVMNALWHLIDNLFGIQIKPVTNAQTWHPQVKVYRLTTDDGHDKGYLYIDLFARPGKQRGTWMGDLLARRRTASGKLQPGIALLTCNFTPPTPQWPTTLTHDDVCTLFHEMGHCLHHLLTEVEVARLSGTAGVAWDGVELPSQMLELWCWQPDFLTTLTRHIETGETMPRDMITRLNQSRTFLSALSLLRQLEYALFDLRLHRTRAINSEADIQKCLDEVRQQIAVAPTWPNNRFQHTFCHVFAGGYAAGYYSYLWAEVMACDAFEAFLEEGLMDRNCGERFRDQVLARGGARDMADNFLAFRGRSPLCEALLAHYGIKN